MTPGAVGVSFKPDFLELCSASPTPEMTRCIQHVTFVTNWTQHWYTDSMLATSFTVIDQVHEEASLTDTDVLGLMSSIKDTSVVIKELKLPLVSEH